MRGQACGPHKNWLFLMSFLDMTIEIWFFGPKIQMDKKHLLPTFPFYSAPNYGHFLIGKPFILCKNMYLPKSN